MLKKCSVEHCWDAVIKQARGGSADPLKPLGHAGTVGAHPVAKAIKADPDLESVPVMLVTRAWDVPVKVM